MSKVIVVTGANGAQGAAITQLFAERGYQVRGVTRSGGGPIAGVSYAAADLGDAEALVRAMHGADAVVFTSPLDHRPGARERMAEAVVAAAGRAGVGRVVLNTAGPVFDGYDRPVSAVLRRLREIVRGGTTPAVVLQPTVYMDNLRAAWALPAIARDGILAYPLPPDTRASWVSHRTLGEYAAAAVESAAAAGLAFDIGGATAVTGSEIADMLSARIGRTVTYVPIPLDEFAAGLNQAYGAPAGDDIADLYRYAADNPAALVRNPAADDVLDVAPESFADFVARHEWSTHLA